MDVTIKDNGSRPALGIPLLEVFSVSIDKDVDEERRSEIYGAIRVFDGRGTEACLYDRGLQNSEAISQNKTLTLTGPHQCISALTAFTIDLDLKDKYQDLGICKGRIHWDMNYESYFDELLTIYVPGMKISAAVHLAVFRLASQAAVEVCLYRKVKDSDEYIRLDAGEVYGKIVAHYGFMFEYSTDTEKKYFQTILFDREPANSTRIETDKSISLLRPVISVPSYASLVVEVDLFVSISNVGNLDGSSNNAGSMHVKGSTADFLPRQHLQHDIEGDVLVAEVNVDWRQSTWDADYK